MKIPIGATQQLTLDQAMMLLQQQAGQMQQIDAVRQQLGFMLAALLNEKHSGVATVSLTALDKAAREQKDIRFEELKVTGEMRVLVLGTNIHACKHCAGSGIDGAVPPAPEPKQEMAPVIAVPPVTEQEDKPSEPCSNAWHADIDGQGVFCPQCGSKAKIGTKVTAA